MKFVIIVFRLILSGALLVAIHKARYYRTNDYLALGPGPFVKALEFATDKTAQIVGKPEKTFFLTALRQLQARPEDTVMIGDVCLVSMICLYELCSFLLDSHISWGYEL